jgi:hypothetical protein
MVFQAIQRLKYILLTQLETFIYRIQNIKNTGGEQNITSKITFYFDVLTSFNELVQL